MSELQGLVDKTAEALTTTLAPLWKEPRPSDVDLFENWQDQLQRLGELSSSWLALRPNSSSPDPWDDLSGAIRQRGADQDVVDDFRVYVEGCNLIRFSDDALATIAERVIKVTFSHPDVVGTSLPLSSETSLEDRMLSDTMWRLWHWVYWWHSSIDVLRPSFLDKWSMVREKFVILLTVAWPSRDDLRWYFLRQHVERLASSLGDK